MKSQKIVPRLARIKAGLSREQLAASAGISISTVNLCEQKKRWPVQSRVLSAYRRALGLTEAAK